VDVVPGLLRAQWFADKGSPVNSDEHFGKLVDRYSEQRTFIGKLQSFLVSQVRHEYSFVRDADWRIGRTKELHAFLDDDKLFHTPLESLAIGSVEQRSSGTQLPTSQHYRQTFVHDTGPFDSGTPSLVLPRCASVKIRSSRLLCTPSNINAALPLNSCRSPSLLGVSHDSPCIATFDRDGAIGFSYDDQIVEMDMAVVRFTEQCHHLNIG
jgi:hypothetical protein